MRIAIASANPRHINSRPLTVIEDPEFKDVLIPVLTDYPLRLPTVYAIYVSRKHVPPKIQAFIDLLMEYNAKIPLERINATV